jgi:hypothetical protein
MSMTGRREPLVPRCSPLDLVRLWCGALRSRRHRSLPPPGERWEGHTTGRSCPSLPGVLPERRPRQVDHHSDVNTCINIVAAAQGKWFSSGRTGTALNR